jgi:uncharacterized protein (TIGR02594 family)
MPRVLISYRRADSLAITGRIFDRLVSQYGKAAIYRDIDNIPLGADFRTDIDKALKESDVLLVIIGHKWLSASKDGRRRIDDENDQVRVEVETALERGIPVIPVLVDQAKMPAPQRLPATLKGFTFRNAVEIDSGPDFDPHVQRLLRKLDEIVAPRRKIPWRALAGAAALAVLCLGVSIAWFKWSTQAPYPWIAVAQKEVGQREIAGPEENPRILQYFSTLPIAENLATDPKVKRLPREQKEQRVKEMIAAGEKPRDDLHDWAWGFTEWTLNQAGISGAKSSDPDEWLKWGSGTDDPKVGAVAIVKGSENNHIGFVVKVYDLTVDLLAGNQSNSVNISNVARSDIAGYRMPAASAAGR